MGVVEGGEVLIDSDRFFDDDHHHHHYQQLRQRHGRASTAVAMSGPSGAEHRSAGSAVCVLESRRRSASGAILGRWHCLPLADGEFFGSRSRENALTLG